MAEYGFSERFLNTNPAIKKLVDQAEENGWTMEKFLDEVRKTGWWKNHSDAERRFDVSRAENPGEVARNISQLETRIRLLATRMGFASRDAAIHARNLATQAARQGWDDEEIRLYLGSKYRRGRDQSGMIGQAKADLEQMAANYGVRVSPRWLNDATRGILSGRRATEDYEAYFREQAKRQYSAIASQLESGFTVRDVLEPYIQVAAEELGRNPNAIDIRSPMWSAAVNYTPKGQNESRAMTQDEWLARIRTDDRYGWDSTQKAQQAAAQFGNELARAFGALG